MRKSELLFKDDSQPFSAKALNLVDTLLLSTDQELEAQNQSAKTNKDIYLQFQEKYYWDPVGFARDCIKWNEGEGLAPYQENICRKLIEHKRVAARGPQRTGKSFASAILVLWFTLTRDGTDWKVFTTASIWSQLEKFLWPEIHKWARRIDYDKVGRESLIDAEELMSLKIKGRTGEAFALTSNKAALTEGGHADKVLFIFDESKQISEDIFDSAEGTLSSAKSRPGREALVLAISTPGEPLGRFYDIHMKKQGFEDWHTIHVTKEEVIAARQIDQEWVDMRKRQWGEMSSLYQNHVEGEFFASDEAGVIPLGWIEAANRRWDQWMHPAPFITPEIDFLDAIGVDVAGQGKDKTVLALRQGQRITELRVFDKQDTMATAGIVTGLLRRYGGKAIVDTNGIGTGMGERLKENDVRHVPFVNQAKAIGKNKTGELGFTNKYSEAWWHLRELLDPTSGNEVALPPHDELTQELTAPHYRHLSEGKIDIEMKEDTWGDESGRTVKQRLGRSHDHAEAVIMAYYEAEKASGFKLRPITGF